MNFTGNMDDDWLNDIQFGNKGAVLFIITYIGVFGLGLICFFVQQLRVPQRQSHELSIYFMKSFWDVSSKHRLYEELADAERLKRIFHVYFANHESFTSVSKDNLQAIVDERAQACAQKYRHKLRGLHISQIDYYFDALQRDKQPISLTETTIDYPNRDYHDHILSISVV